MTLNNFIHGFDQRRLRSTTVQVRRLDGQVEITDRDGHILTTTRSPIDDDLTRYGFIANDMPDLQVGDIEVEALCFSFGSQDTAADLDILRLHGVTHIVNLVSPFVPNYFPNQFKYLSLTLYDDLQADLGPPIKACHDFVRSHLIPDGGKLFIHCNAGRSRAPSVLIGCLFLLFGMSFDDAFQLLNETRVIAPNLNFKIQLRRLCAFVSIDALFI